jgi:hypothetical protein
MKGTSVRGGGVLMVLLSVVGAASVTTLTWVGYRSVKEWRRSAALIATRRAQSEADRLFTAVTRDMRAVQASVLPTLNSRAFHAVQPSQVDHRVSSALARYPYPELFVSWDHEARTDVIF